ncbi:MAG: flagellar basal body P-ring formation chaperone FlgA [Xanthobacteraceae bacterium]
MIRPVVRTLALLLALAGSAAAQTDRPALRASVTVSSAVVRIGDLVENAGPVADIPIFRAPDLGTTGAVATERIVEAIRPHQLIDIDTSGLAEVIVTRSSRAITAREFSARIAQALSGQYGLGEARNISVNFDRAVHTLQVEPSATGELQVVALNYDPRTSRFDVTLDLPSGLEFHRQPPRFTGTAIETVDAVAVDRPVEHGEVLRASDLAVLRQPKAPDGAITDIGAVVGLAARHQLRPGQPLAAADLMKPEIVQRNDTVTLVYQAPGLTLTLRGQAQEAGALGNTIGVLNVQTKRVVQGIVTGAGRVSVSTATTHLVDNAPQPARGPASDPPQTPE